MAENKENISKQEEDIISLPELVNEVSKYVQGKSSEEELNKLGDRISIRSYIPLAMKLSVVSMLIFNMDLVETEQYELKIIEKQKRLFFDVLLSTYTNIDCNYPDFTTVQTYDLLYPILANYILQYCRDDYETIVDMINSSLDMYHIQELYGLVNTLDYKKLKEENERNHAALEKITANKKLVKDLKELFLGTDITSRTLVEAANTQEIKKKLKEIDDKK